MFDRPVAGILIIAVCIGVCSISVAAFDFLLEELLGPPLSTVYYDTETKEFFRKSRGGMIPIEIDAAEAAE